MLAYLVAAFFIIVIACQYMNGRATTGLFLAYTLLSPYISVGSLRIDSLYMGVLVFWILIAVKNRGILRVHTPRSFVRYYQLILLVFSIYFLSWVIFNRNHWTDLFSVYAGAAKILLCMQACLEMNYGQTAATMKRQVYSLICALTVLNLIMIAIQRLDVSLGMALIKALQNDASYAFAVVTTQWGLFDRCFGAMPYPMQLGIFSLLAHTFLVFEQQEHFRFRRLFIVLNLLAGVFSATKTFMAGIVVITVLWLLTETYFNRVRRKSVFVVAAILIVLVLAFLFFDGIYQFLYDYIGPNYARYWGFLRNIVGIFTSRYSSEAEYLSYMPDFLKLYWLMGVGPVSLKDEAIIDSALYVILHNGGVLALVPVLAFYLRYLAEFFLARKQQFFMLTAVIIITGSGFQTWIVSDASAWVLFILLYLQAYKEDTP